MSTAAKPTVHEAWAQTMRDLSPVGKDGWNESQRFKFRGIDQVMNALAGPMRKNGTFVIPEVEHAEYVTSQDGRFTSARLTVRFTLYGPAGDSITGSSQGEAKDTYDKATSKALAMAFKYFLFYAGMIPLDASSIDDADRHSPGDDGGGEGNGQGPTAARTAARTGSQRAKAGIGPGEGLRPSSARPVTTNITPQDLANKAIEAFNNGDDDALKQVFRSTTKAQQITTVQDMTGEQRPLGALIQSLHAELTRGGEPA